MWLTSRQRALHTRSCDLPARERLLGATAASGQLVVAHEGGLAHGDGEELVAHARAEVIEGREDSQTRLFVHDDVVRRPAIAAGELRSVR